MPSLTFEDIEVDSLDGPAPAKLFVCECGGRLFVAYLVRCVLKAHMHLQCADCGESYCDGGCEGDVPGPGPEGRG